MPLQGVVAVFVDPVVYEVGGGAIELGGPCGLRGEGEVPDVALGDGVGVKGVPQASTDPPGKVVMKPWCC